MAGDHWALTLWCGALRPFKSVQSVVTIQLIQKAGFEDRTRDVIVAAKSAANCLPVKRCNSDIFGLCPTNGTSYWSQVRHSPSQFAAHTARVAKSVIPLDAHAAKLKVLFFRQNPKHFDADFA